MNSVRKLTLNPLSAALLLALPLLVAAPAGAAPATVHWTVTDVGTLGGSFSRGNGINNAGQVTGWAVTAGDADQRAFLYSDGAMINLGTLGGTYSEGLGINNAGQVTGYADTASNARHAFLYGNSIMTDLGDIGSSSFGYGINDAGHVAGYLNPADDGTRRAFLYRNGTIDLPGTLGGTSSRGYAINGADQVTGHADTADGTRHAFLYSNSAMTDLGTLGGRTSEGRGINNAGQVTGFSDTTGNTAEHAFLYSHGVMTDLGTLGGLYSYGYGINNAGQVAGMAFSGGNERAFLYTQGTMHDVSSFNGVAGSGWTLTEARGINDVGQIVGTGNGPAGQRAYILTLDTTVWSGEPNASWDDAANWSYGIGPNRNTRAYIEPLGSRTVLGPTGAVEVKWLTIGGDPLDGLAIATLKLNGGYITLFEEGALVTANGVLTGQGTLDILGGGLSRVSNHGRIVADDVTLVSTLLDNFGTIEGNGRLALEYSIYNRASIRIAHAGDRLRLDTYVNNLGEGTIDVVRGEVDISIGVFNADGGRINLRDGVLRTGQSGLENNSRLSISSGASDVFGRVINREDGSIVVSGQGQATFWNRVENFGELQVSSGAVATFFGDFYARTGGTLSGTGSKYYEAGYFIGNSPGISKDAGNVTFSRDARVEIEIGGTSPGDGDGFHDQLIVLGELDLGGTLKLVSWDGFVGQAGQTFDLFDWGTLTGRFDDIDSSGFLLAAGTKLDMSTLYDDGAIRVAAVPEPETCALLLAGLGLVGGAARRGAGRI